MPFVELQEVLDQLEFEVDEQGRRQAYRRIEMAGNLCRHYAGIDWTDLNVPAVVRDITLNVVERYMRNPDAYTQSRAGDETVAWSDRGQGQGLAFYFTEDEREILANLGQPVARIGSMTMTPWRSRGPLPDVWVPVDYDGKWFPWIAGTGPDPRLKIFR